MNLTLADEDVALLRQILDEVLRDLSYEIADTDNSKFRGRLRTRRERIEAIHRQVGGTTG